MGTGGRWARALLGVGLATFALPSLTAMLWSGGRHTHQEPLALAPRDTVMLQSMDGTVTGLGVQLGNGGWLCLDLFDSERTVATLSRAITAEGLPPAQLLVVIGGGSGDAREARLEFSLPVEAAAPDAGSDPGEPRWYVATYCRCRVRDTLAGHTMPWSVVSAEASRTVETDPIAGRILLTPYAVAVDVVTSPLLLLWLPFVHSQLQ